MLELLPKVGPFLIFFEGILNLFFNVVLVESLDVGQSTEHVEHFVETWIPVKKTLKPLITNILPNCRVKIKPGNTPYTAPNTARSNSELIVNSGLCRVQTTI